jgi:hypothetical protein
MSAENLEHGLRVLMFLVAEGEARFQQFVKPLPAQLRARLSLPTTRM